MAANLISPTPGGAPSGGTIAPAQAMNFDGDIDAPTGKHDSVRPPGHGQQRPTPTGHPTIGSGTVPTPSATKAKP